MSADEACLIKRFENIRHEINQHYENTKQVINFLRKQKAKILYPYKPSSKNYNYEKILFRYSGLLSVIKSKKIIVIKFVNSLELLVLVMVRLDLKMLQFYKNFVPIKKMNIFKEESILDLKKMNT